MNNKITLNIKLFVLGAVVSSLPLISLMACSKPEKPSIDYQKIANDCEEEMNSIVPANERPSVDDTFGTSTGSIILQNFLDGINGSTTSDNFITRLPSDRYKELEITWGFCQRVLLGYSKSFAQEGNTIIEVENPSVIIPGLENTEIITTTNLTTGALTGGNKADYVVNAQPNAALDDAIRVAGYSLNWTCGSTGGNLYGKTGPACGSAYSTGGDICLGSNWFGMVFGVIKSNLLMSGFYSQLSIPSYYYQSVTDWMLRPIA